eukprot:7811318-Pyramimonas_sp.AAC.1
MANTDAKLLSACACCPLNSVAQLMISESQAGGFGPQRGCSYSSCRRLGLHRACTWPWAQLAGSD